MRTLRIWTLVLGSLAVWVAPARSDEPKGLVPEEGAVELILLRQESVQQELKLTEAEAAKIHEFVAGQWKKAQAIDRMAPDARDREFAQLTRDNERFLGEVLKPEQRRRLHQIALQFAGLLWVTRQQVASELKLTEDQKTKAHQLQKAAQKEMQDLLASGTREGRREKLQELRRTSRERLMGLLTDEQKAKWKEMAGERFEGRFRFDPEGEQ